MRRGLQLPLLSAWRHSLEHGVGREYKTEHKGLTNEKQSRAEQGEAELATV